MPQFRPRPSVGGFAAPARGGDLGAAIGGVADVLGGIAQGRQRAELQDIAFEQELDRAQQIQTDNLDKSEVLKAVTLKRRARLDEFARINEEALANGNYEGVLDDLDSWNSQYDQDLLQDASPGFQRLFPISDAPIHAGKQNQMATAQARGNFQIMENNYGETLNNLLASVEPDMLPSELVEMFSEASEGATAQGFSPGHADSAAQIKLADAMENLVKMQPITAGIALLNDKSVKKVLGKDRAEIVRGDLLRKNTRTIESRRVINESIKRTTNIDVLGAINSGQSQSEINLMIRNSEWLSDEDIKTTMDFADTLYIQGVPKGKDFDPSINHSFAQNSIDVLIDQHTALMAKSDDISEEETEKELLSLNDQAIEIIAEATRQNMNGEFKGSNYDELVWSAAPITQSLMTLKQKVDQDNRSLMEKAVDGFNIISPWDIPATRDEHIPFSEVATISNDMVRGTGQLGHLSPTDRVFMKVLLADEAFKRDDSNLVTDSEGSLKITNEIVQSAKERFIAEKYGLTGDAAKKRGEQVFDARTLPAIKTQPTPGLVQSIQNMLDDGSTVSEIRAEAERNSGFNEAAFSNALSQVSAPEVDLSLPEPISDRAPVSEAGEIDDAGIDFLKQWEGFSGTAEHILDEKDLTVGHGHKGDDVTEGREVDAPQAHELLRGDTKIAASDVRGLVPNWRKLDQHEFNTMVSLLMNAGATNVNAKTRAIRALNRALEGDERDEEAIQEFLFEAFDEEAGFTKARNKKGVLVKIKGLVNRRAAERAMFEGS